MKSHCHRYLKSFVDIKAAPIKFCLFILLTGITACQDDIISHDFRVTPGDLKNEVLTDVAILYSDSAVVRVKVSGKELVRSLDAEQGKEEFTKGVFVEFFNETGQVTSTLKADYAFRNENKDEITVQGNVLLTSNKKETMETDELIWDKRKEIVYTEKFVLVKTAKEQAWGHGFVSNQNFTEWRIKGFEGQLPAEKMGVE
jgi:LPS export ABC transporter protein LptC